MGDRAPRVTPADEKALEELQSPQLRQAVEALKRKLEWAVAELEKTEARLIDEMNRACPACGATDPSEDGSYLLGMIRCHPVTAERLERIYGDGVGQTS